MRLFLPPLEIDETEGFTPEKDIFGRKPIGDGLTNLVTSISQPLVIAVDAQWGSGKTTFLKMWAGDLRKNGVSVIFFDAFETDYLEDAFAAIAGQIVTLARDKHKQNTKTAKRFQEKAIIAGRVLARGAVKVGVKLGTAGILKAEDLEEAGKEIGDELSNLTDKYVGEIITKQKEAKAAIEEFRLALADLPSLLATNSASSEDEVKPLVIVIDELDRCKPSFALQILERIKHFFAVSNVHFVLGVHLGQLENSVRAAYGSEIDASLYLQKFITLPVMLIDPLNDVFVATAERYSK